MRVARYSDERLASAVRRGHPEAFAELYRRHHQALYRYCRSLVRHDEDAQDALQSAMSAAFRALCREDRDLAVRPWLFRIVHNEAMSLLRVRGRVGLELEKGEEGIRATSVESEPHVAFERRERLNTLIADLQALPSRQRAALLMRELSGLTIVEIAAALSTTPGAAKQALFEARQALHELEDGRAMDCDAVRQMILEGDGRVLRARRIRSHLRACPQCSELHESIATRTADLHALAPLLPGAVAAKLLADVLRHAGLDHASAAAAASSLSAASGGSATAGSSSTAGIAAHLGGPLAGKLALGAIALTIAAGGGAGIAVSSGGHSTSHKRHGRQSAVRRAPKRAEIARGQAARSKSQGAQMPSSASHPHSQRPVVRSQRRQAEFGRTGGLQAKPAITRDRGHHPGPSEASASGRGVIRSGRPQQGTAEAPGSRAGVRVQERSASHHALGSGPPASRAQRRHALSSPRARRRSLPRRRRGGQTRSGRAWPPASSKRHLSPSSAESHRNAAPAPETPASPRNGEPNRESEEHASGRQQSPGRRG